MVVTKHNQTEQKASNLINDLGHRNTVIRNRAYEAIVSRGKNAVPDLIGALQNASEYTRWEIARAFGEIGDPTGANALVGLLEDESLGVRWAASESLVQLGRASIRPLLEALTKRFDSVWLRNGAHHVFHVLNQRRQLNEDEKKVFDALESVVPEVKVPWAAEVALEAILFPGAHNNSHRGGIK